MRLTKGTFKPSLLCANYRPCRPATSQAASRAAEVESLCKAHYDEFVTAVDELRFVQEEGLALRKAVEAQDDSVQAGGARVLRALEGLVAVREGAERMGRAAAAADGCLAALEACAGTNAALARRDSYAAIRTLGELRQVHLPALREAGGGAAALAEHLERCAPRAEARVVRQVTAELNAWLTEARDRARSVGMAGVRAATARRRRLAELGKAQGEALEAMQSGEAPRFPLGLESGEEEAEAEAAEEDDGTTALDLVPLHRCAHVQRMLGRADAFCTYYAENRGAQLRSDLSGFSAGLGASAAELSAAGGDPGAAFMQSYQSSVAQVVGFFLIEARVLRSGAEAMSAAAARALWGQAAQALASALRASAGVMRDPGQVLVVRDFVALAADAVRAAGFDARPLDAALSGTRDMYTGLLAQDAAQELTRALEEGQFEPLELTAEGDLQRRVLRFDLHRVAQPGEGDTNKGADTGSSATEGADANSVPGLPWRAPFSASVPRACGVVFRFVGDLASFLGSAAVPPAEARAALTSGIGALLATAAPAALDRALGSGALSAAKAVRLAIDAEALRTACAAVGRHAHAACWAEMRAEPPRELLEASEAALKAAYNRARSRAADVLGEHVDRYLESGAARTWALDAPPAAAKGQTMASTEMEDCAERLSAAFASMRPFLWAREYESLCAQPLRQAGAWLAGALASEASRHWNPWGLAALDADLRRLEEAVKAAGLGAEHVALAEARQLVSLLQSQSLGRLDEAGYLARQYPRLTASKVLVVLDKYREPPTARGERDAHMRQKAVQQAVRKLRAASRQ